jgi:adenosylcobinamide-GDP ribazoletransferase
MYRYDYARDINSKSQLAVYKPNKRELCFATIMALMPLWLLPEICLLIVIPVLVVNRLLGNFFYRCIGGYTGDCLGASQQIAEVVIYSGFGAIWKFI